MSYSKSQYTLMIYDPRDGSEKPYPSHAGQFREYHGNDAWIYNPWTGDQRDSRDIASDVLGNGIHVESEPLFSA